MNTPSSYNGAILYLAMYRLHLYSQYAVGFHSSHTYARCNSAMKIVGGLYIYDIIYDYGGS